MRVGCLTLPITEGNQRNTSLSANDASYLHGLKPEMQCMSHAHGGGLLIMQDLHRASKAIEHSSRYHVL